MFDASEKSLLKHQLFRFRWLLWCFLPSLFLVWTLFLLLAVVPEHWVQRMDSSLPNWELWGAVGFLFLTVFLSCFVNGIIVFKALGERFRLSSLLRALITAAVFLFGFPVVLGSLITYWAPWFRSSTVGELASNQTTLEFAIHGALVVSAHLLSLMAMIGLFPLIFILALALFQRSYHQPPDLS